MDYRSQTTGILLVNLGSPNSTSVEDVRKYLHEFLMDERVIDVPWLLRKFIVCCTILPTRPASSAEAYKTIWTKEGSPLLVINRKVQKDLQEKISVPVALSMRYGAPSCQAGLKKLLQETNGKLEKVFVIPLYPHYAMSSYETAVVAVQKAANNLKLRAQLQFQPSFYEDDSYIDALISVATPYLQQNYDHLLFSYHGIPERHIHKSDKSGSHCLQKNNCCHVVGCNPEENLEISRAHACCYRHQVYKTTELFIKKAGIPEQKYSVAFQSRLGKYPWLEPYTDLEIEKLAKNNVKKLLVICPSFVADCLETLEEIAIRGKETFLHAGGTDLQLIPCLNDHPQWINVLQQWCNRFQ